MIKFFRKIRQNMIKENKVSKYLLYAIGEIILVVIGILIALSINNWNEQMKENEHEQIILNRLQKEFDSNKKQLYQKIEIRNKVIKNCIDLLNYYDNPETATLDSLIKKQSRLITPATFDPVKNDLVSSGNIEILKNEQLKQLLINWSTDVIQLQEVEQMFLRYSENQMIPYLDKIGIQRDVAFEFWEDNLINLLETKAYTNPVPRKSKINMLTKEILLNNATLESQISYALLINEFNNQESITLMKRIDEILKLINLEIKQ